MKRGAHLLAHGPAGVEGRFVREIMLFLDGISVGGQSTIEREGSPLYCLSPVCGLVWLAAAGAAAAGQKVHDLLT